MTTPPLDLTNGEWRAFQSIPEQGHSHREWIDNRIAERVAGLLARVETAEFDASIDGAYVTVARSNVEFLLKEREEDRVRSLTAAAKVAAVRELHHKDDQECAICRDAYGDHVHYPCETIRALGAPETETAP